jgi:hypothetical protein
MNQEQTPIEHRLGRLETLLAEQNELLFRMLLGEELQLLGTNEMKDALGVGKTKLNELVQRGDLQTFMLEGKRVTTPALLRCYIRSLASTN